MERRRTASYRDDEKADRILEGRSSCDKQEEKAYERKRGSYHDLNLAGKLPIKEKDHTMKMSRERRPPTGY